MMIREMLETEFKRKNQKNSSYSIRAFARDIGIGKSTLYDFLYNDQRLSKVTCEKLLKYLNVPEQQRDEILDYYLNPKSDKIFQEISSEDFIRISTCEHYAILSLSRRPSFYYDKKIVSTLISVNTDKLEGIVDDLLSLGLITLKDKILTRTSRPLTTSYDVPSEAIKKFHRSGLERSKRALDEINVELRDITSSIFLMDPEKMKKIKGMIKDLRRELVSTVESNTDKSEAFLLNISLLPLSGTDTANRN